MSDRWECNACHGIYTDPQADGVSYFHVCPPLELTPAKGDPGGKGFVPATYGPRPGHRDENVVVDVDRTDPEMVVLLPARVRSEGLGRTKRIAAAAPEE